MTARQSPEDPDGPERPGDEGPRRGDVDEAMLDSLVAEAQAAAPMDVRKVADRCGKALGLDRMAVYLVDLQQRRLTPLSDDDAAAGEGSLDVDASEAGWAYRTLAPRVEETDGHLRLWVPLVDGVERVGVLGAWTASLDSVRLRRCRMLAPLLAMLITSKRAHSDSFARRTRTDAMGLGTEMLRTLLPPRTIGNAQVVSTGVLEPAYEIGGDAFDHSLGRTHLHTAILDSLGHDLSSGLTTALALAGCRNARRTGLDLLDMVHEIDDALARWLPDQFCTGVLTRLDLVHGVLHWCNCGHPPPLLLRDRQVVPEALERSPQPPMGLPGRLTDEPRQVHEVALRPGDRVLFYTDGVVEARSVGGAQFGLDRFTDYIIRASAAGELAPETLRRLMHEILDRNIELRDDATMLLVEWNPR